MKRYKDCSLTPIVKSFLNCSSFSSLLLKTGADTPLGNGYFIDVSNSVNLLNNNNNINIKNIICKIFILVSLD